MQFHISETPVVAALNTEDALAIQAESGVNIDDISSLTDGNMTTCVKLKRKRKLLQFILEMPVVSGQHQLMLMATVQGMSCDSAATVWFTSSDCAPTVFQQCSSKFDRRLDDQKVCKLSCSCNLGCEYVHLKAHHLPYESTYKSAICEVAFPQPEYVDPEPAVGDMVALVWG